MIYFGTLICYLSLLHYRYDMASNRWQEESHVPKKTPHNSAFGFVVLDGELHVLTLLNAFDPQETRRKQHHKRAGTLYIQIYHPKKKTWRTLITKSPFHHPLDFNTAVMCSIRLWTIVILICVLQGVLPNHKFTLSQQIEKRVKQEKRRMIHVWVIDVNWRGRLPSAYLYRPQCTALRVCLNRCKCYIMSRL